MDGTGAAAQLLSVKFPNVFYSVAGGGFASSPGKVNSLALRSKFEFSAADSSDEAVKELQAKYESLQADKKKAQEEVKDSGLGMLKAVKAAKASAAKDEL